MEREAMEPGRLPFRARFAAFAPAVALVGLAFAMAGLTGCSPHLAGTNDASLDYEVEPEGPRAAGAAGPAAGVSPPQAGEAVDLATAAALTKARLSSAEVNADVDVTDDGRRIRVIIDADAVPTIEALLAWRGGLSILPVGSAVAPDTPAIAELPIASIASAFRGRALALTFPPEARRQLVAEAAAHPGETVVVARARTRYATMSIEDALAAPMIVSFGDDVTAYTRASHARDLLASPPLPRMRRVAVTRLPENRPLAIACVVLPFLLSFAWLAFVRRFDRARPEPMWLVVATFALGGLSVIPAGIAEVACAAATPWLDPSVMTLGGQAWALPIAIMVFTLVVGLAEEGSKFLGAWSLARHRHEFDEPIDGIIYGCAAALGFAAVENVKYFAVGRMSGVVIAVRAFITVPAHFFFAAIWGYALGRRLVSRRTSVLAFFALAALAHGAFDALLSTAGMQLVSTILVLALAFGFVAMLQSALRYGAIVPPPPFAGNAPPTEPLPAGELGRRYFRVGSARAFYAASATLIASAFALTVLGGAYEYLHHRIGVVFVSLATAILALFGLAAYGASETIPLDVAIDAQGVTLGGARTPWRAVVSLAVEVTGARARVVLHTTERAVFLGPTTVATANELAASIRAVHAVV